VGANTELAIIGGIVALAGVFLAVKTVKIIRAKRPDCCAGKK
jgi:hypothetical protein